MRLPVVVEGVDLPRWLAARAGDLYGMLDLHGAVLFRGCVPADVARFEAAAQLICRELHDGYGDLPREAEGRRVYKATPYPARLAIRLHNEGSHTRSWPSRIMFFCMQPAVTGGESVLADGREVLRRLPAELVTRFAERKLSYLRNFVRGFDVTWQSFFQTVDRERVTDWLAQHGIEFGWTDAGLRTRWPAAAMIRHPRTGEDVWFNQIQLHHIACLPPGPRNVLARLFGDDVPRNVTYGDGEPIDDATVATIAEAMEAASVHVALDAGDLLLADNMLVSHGRAPFVGERRIAVAMGAMVGAR
jgi:alpha-ketoglutarate-dependent taurine dioxygenase